MDDKKKKNAKQQSNYRSQKAANETHTRADVCICTYTPGRKDNMSEHNSKHTALAVDGMDPTYTHINIR